MKINFLLRLSSWLGEQLSFDYNFTVIFLVVSQEYSTKAEDEYVIKGNDVLIKCKIPSFVADFVQIIGWIDNDHKPILADGNNSNFFSLFLKFMLYFLPASKDCCQLLMCVKLTFKCKNPILLKIKPNWLSIAAFPSNFMYI